MKTENLSITVPADLKQKIKDLADTESRNLSNMVTVLLQEALKNKSA